MRPMDRWDDAVAQPTVLIVDDTRLNLRMLSRQLRNAAYRVLEAEDGIRGYHTALEHRPDLILLDVMMPGRDGFEVCSMLKADERTRDIPVIFLTGKTDTVDRVRGLDLGAVDYITKPFDSPEVLARVRTQIQIKTLYDGVQRELAERKRIEKMLRRRAALDQVRVSVYEMRESADIAQVLTSLYGGLKETGMGFDNFSIQFVDEEEDYFEAHSIGPDRVELRIARGALKQSAVYEAYWKGAPVYRRDLHAEDRYADRGNIRKKRARSVLDVPFSHGTIAVNSLQPNAFSEEDIETLQQFADVLSEAYTRFEDVRKIAESERALKEYSERLEEMVEERTAALREVQEQLIRRERMAILGQLAGGVGHELRNPLGAIRNAAYFLDMALEEPEPTVREAIEILEKEVKTSDRIITSLLDFARGKPPVRQEVDANGLVREILARIDVPENIEIVCHLNEELPHLSADPDQLGQVFGNIILNAIQAMSEGGWLTIRSDSADRGGPAEGPEWVVVSYTDTGEGISEENLDKLFEPLFTTKSKGIGLGLALTRTLVEGHGGTIEVESMVGEGSTFIVRLPIGRQE